MAPILFCFQFPETGPDVRPHVLCYLVKDSEKKAVMGWSIPLSKEFYWVCESFTDSELMWLDCEKDVAFNLSKRNRKEKERK